MARWRDCATTWFNRHPASRGGRCGPESTASSSSNPAGPCLMGLTLGRLLRVCQRSCVATAWSSACLRKDCRFPKSEAECTTSARAGWHCGGTEQPGQGAYQSLPHLVRAAPALHVSPSSPFLPTSSPSRELPRRRCLPGSRDRSTTHQLGLCPGPSHPVYGSTSAPWVSASSPRAGPRASATPGQIHVP